MKDTLVGSQRVLDQPRDASRPAHVRLDVAPWSATDTCNNINTISSTKFYYSKEQNIFTSMKID